ncbi:MAG TPA: hypothetical protein VFH78_05210 [Candidatus Thermoplasmatota archaeon]|nr:hypothetical protein [Candidatus Thermoplasmatota archaeon]
MTTATSADANDDEDVVTMDLVEEPAPRRELLSPAAARIAFLSLAGVAGVALLAAVLIIALAPDSALTWLVVSLVVLVAVVIAEVVLLVLARPKRTT